MKNVIIATLVIVVGILGFVIVSDLDSDDTNTTTSSDSQAASDINSDEVASYANQGLESVPMSIFSDRSITNLDLSGNNLTGALPAEIRQLSNLEVLDASGNNLTGIPAEIGQLSKLRSIDFSDNDISGLPYELGNLSNLETLDLRGNPNVSQLDLDRIQPDIPQATILTD